MKIKEGFVLREVAGSNVVVAVGKASLSFKGLVNLNETGTFLFKELEKGVESEEELVLKLINAYDVDEFRATEDVNAFLRELKGAGIIE